MKQNTNDTTTEVADLKAYIKTLEQNIAWRDEQGGRLMEIILGGGSELENFRAEMIKMKAEIMANMSKSGPN
jgi:hypothetical protein